MRVGFHTFGCKLNQCETEGLAAPYAARGFEVVTASQEADLYIINTCTVTARADHKARGMIRGLAARHPSALIVVTGCAAALEGDGYSHLAPNITVIPQVNKALLLDLASLLPVGGAPFDAARALRSLGGIPVEDGTDPFRIQAGMPRFHTRAYLKIQDGCDSRCSYCRVPLARGGSVSLDAAEVVRRARALESAGPAEIVITGVNISSYRDSGLGLSGLLCRLLEQTARPRYRLSSLEPEAIDGALATAFSSPRICGHAHIPIQSGSDAVLRRMRRRYDAEAVRGAIHSLRAAKDDPFIAADILVGFPGETEEDFQQTRGLVQEEGLAALHVFPFSPRPGTEAASLDGRVPERVRDQRAAVLGGLSRSLAMEYAARWEGRVVEVILEAQIRGEPSVWSGTSGNYLTLRVEGVPPGSGGRGRLTEVRVGRPGQSGNRGGGQRGGASAAGEFLSFKQ
jgi:threonylcarbamoyladenosine tRNA methylthiotransferase MtaB